MEINNLSEIDLANIPLPQIRARYGTFRAGRAGGRAGVQTAIGDVLEKVWYEAVERIALREYESWIVDCLEEYFKRDPCPTTRREARREALDLYASRMFENEMWVGYIPFNRKYCPDAIKGKQFVTVIAECCNKPGEITRARFDSGDTICPVCGRFIKVKQVSGELIPEKKNLSREEISIDRELIVMDNGISAYIETWFDVDEKFSLDTKDTDIMVDFYALYNPDSDILTCSYVVKDGSESTEHPYLPTREETALIKAMMEETCMNEYNCDLYGLWNDTEEQGVCA